MLLCAIQIKSKRISWANTIVEVKIIQSERINVPSKNSIDTVSVICVHRMRENGNTVFVTAFSRAFHVRHCEWH